MINVNKRPKSQTSGRKRVQQSNFYVCVKGINTVCVVIQNISVMMGQLVGVVVVVVVALLLFSFLLKV